MDQEAGRAPAADITDFAAFVSATRGQMRRWAYLVCRDWDRAEDIVQACLERLYPRWEKVQRAEGPHRGGPVR